MAPTCETRGPLGGFFAPSAACAANRGLYCSQTVLASECCSSHLWISNVMFEPSEMNASQTACACYKWTSSGTLFSHSGVNSTEHGMFDHIGPVRHKTLFLPLVEKLV